MGSQHDRPFQAREELGLPDQGVESVGVDHEWLIGFGDQELEELRDVWRLAEARARRR